jgi:hypothetical protein
MTDVALVENPSSSPHRLEACAFQFRGIAFPGEEISLLQLEAPLAFYVSPDVPDRAEILRSSAGFVLRSVRELTEIAEIERTKPGQIPTDPWRRAGVFLAESVANAVDAIFLALDEGVRLPEDAKIAVQVLLQYHEGGHSLFCEVWDNGPGLPSSIFEALRLGERSNSTKTKGGFIGGCGLGMEVIQSTLQTEGDTAIICSTSGEQRIDLLLRRESGSVSRITLLDEPSSGRGTVFQLSLAL